MTDSRNAPRRQFGADPTTSVLDFFPSTVVVLDEAARIVYVNRMVEAVFGFTPDQVLGQGIATLLDERHLDPGRVDRLFRRAWRGELQITEVWGRRAVGTSFPLELSIAPAEVQGERACVAVLRDVTARRRLTEQTHRAQKMEAVGRLAGGLAHDLNNILAVVRLNAALVRDELTRLGADCEEIEEIDHAAERARNLTRQLLAFSRQQLLEPRPVDLNPIVRRVVKLMRRLINANVEIVTLLDPAIGCVDVDPSQMDQVLINLMVNAGDAMPSGGHLTVQTRSLFLSREAARAYPNHVEPGHYVVLSVADTGLGMEPEAREHVFEPFFTTKPPGLGTGLGLPTVYGIVKQSKGYIWVETDPGEGSVFEIFLPRSEADAPADEQTYPPEEELTLAEEPTGKRILVVEDEDAVRRAIRETLRAAGYRVVECGDGEDALQIVQRDANDRFDLVLTDLIMPRMGGQELVAHLTTARLRTRVLYMSGYADIPRTRQAGPVLDAPFIAKPFSPRELRDKVREVLGHRVRPISD